MARTEISVAFKVHPNKLVDLGTVAEQERGRLRPEAWQAAQGGKKMASIFFGTDRMRQAQHASIAKLAVWPQQQGAQLIQPLGM